MKQDAISLPKRAVLALLSLAFIVGLMPSMALAGEADTQTSGKYDTVEGTLYLSISDDENFIQSDGDLNTGKYIANMPIDLAEVSKIDLDEYGLGDYNYDSDDDGRYEITMLHVFVYANLHLSSKGIDGLTVTGALHSAYINQFFGMDQNLTYYVNGAYPLDASLDAGMGATCPVIEVSDGDFCNLDHFADWNFYGDSNVGFRYFLNNATDLKQDGVTLEYSVNVDKGLTVSLGTANVSDWATAATDYKTAANTKLYYGSEYTTDTSDVKSVTTGKDGTATIQFDEVGTYYVWMPGQYGTENSKSIVAGPVIAKVNVSDWNRLGGESRLDTMKLVNQEGFAGGSCRNIVLASASGFPDALSASALAGALKAPIVTTSSTDGNGLSNEAADEIERIAAKDATVWIMGGNAAVSDQAKADVEKLGYKAERLGGSDRYDTALKIMDKVEEVAAQDQGKSDTVIVTTGRDFADSLSAASWAYVSTSPIVTVDSGKCLNADQIEAITDGGYTKVLVLGGDARVDYDKLKSDLSGIANLKTTQIAGKSRVQTSAEVAKWVTGNEVKGATFYPSEDTTLGFDGMAVANAWNFPDALCAAGLQGTKKACMLLVDDDKTTRTAIDDVIKPNKSELKISYILGGSAAVSYSVENYLKNL